MTRTTLAALLAATLTPLTAGADPMIQPINPPGVEIPGISQAILTEGGRTMYLSGHVPFDAQGGMATDMAGQLDQVLSNMKGTLAAAGADFDALVRVTFYVKNYDATQLDDLRQVRDRWFTGPTPPASALIGVQELFVPNALVEVDAVAVLPE